MLNRQNPTETKAWKSLELHFEAMKAVEMRDLFAQDEKRFEKFSIQMEDLLVDFSKNRIKKKHLNCLYN